MVGTKSRLYEAYKTDKEVESSGVWQTEYGQSFKLARMGGSNVRYQRELTAAMRPHMREAQLGLIDDTTLDPILKKVFIDTILLDWKDVTAEDGETVLEFNKDNAVKLFEDLPDLYARLRELASNFANYRAAALALAAKN